MGEELTNKVFLVRTVEYVDSAHIRLHVAERHGTVESPSFGQGFTLETDKPLEPFTPGEEVTITVTRGAA